MLYNKDQSVSESKLENLSIVLSPKQLLGISWYWSICSPREEDVYPVFYSQDYVFHIQPSEFLKMIYFLLHQHKKFLICSLKTQELSVPDNSTSIENIL